MKTRLRAEFLLGVKTGWTPEQQRQMPAAEYGSYLEDLMELLDKQ